MVVNTVLTSMYVESVIGDGGKHNAACGDCVDSVCVWWWWMECRVVCTDVQ
jgi:hypothetical protein